MEQRKHFRKPELLREQKDQTAGIEHCHQVKNNDCSFPMKA